MRESMTRFTLVRESDSSSVIAAIGSFAAHVVLVIVCAEVFASTYAVRLPGHSPLDVKRFFDDEIVIHRDGDLGEPDAIGFATNSSDGKETLRAPRAPADQVFLSRDPVGPGRVGNLPSMSIEPEGRGVPDSAIAEKTTAARSSVVVLPAPTAAPTPFGAGRAVEDIGQPHVQSDATALKLPAKTASEIVASAAKPGSSVPAADPAPMSESESDPFSKTGGVDFRGGKMDARFGRAFKSVRPRLTLAAELDLMGLKSPRIVLKIAIDDDGKVTKVDVLRSTGSKLVDQPVTVAMYQWWFEPAKDGSGKSIADELVFPIAWH